MKFGEIVNYGLAPEKYQYLKQDGKCSDESFEEQWKPYILNADFGNCSRKCAPFLLPFDDLPICGWDDHEARWCAEDVIVETWQAFRRFGNYTRPCSILQYSGERNWIDGIDDPHLTSIIYNFLSPELTIYYEEYLTFDRETLLGSIGGTLVICIGFSLSEFFSRMIEFIDKIGKSGRKKKLTKVTMSIANTTKFKVGVSKISTSQLTAETLQDWKTCHFDILPTWLRDNKYLHFGHRPQVSLQSTAWHNSKKCLISPYFCEKW